MFNPADCLMLGEPVPWELLGPMVEVQWDNTNSAELQSKMSEHGHVLIRGGLAEDEVMAAREEVFQRLIEVQEIREPALAGIATGESRRVELQEDLGAFWQSVSEGPALRVASHGERAREVIGALLGTQARPHDYIFLRPGVVGRATRLHYDLPFFARGSTHIVTVWSALGEIPVAEGSLAFVEGSHHYEDLIAPIRQIDYKSKESPRVQLEGDPLDFVRERNTRLLTANFEVGDLVAFSMTILHGTFDNHSSDQRTRLSCDVRWQPAADELDERYFGANPGGTTGIGYAELNGAKPLTQDWHTR